jgi:hypothetical protein
MDIINIGKLLSTELMRVNLPPYDSASLSSMTTSFQNVLLFDVIHYLEIVCGA